MRTSLKRFALALSATAALTVSSFGAQANKAASLDELLTLVKEAKVSVTRENIKRENTFKSSKAQQQTLLTQMKNERTRQERLSERLEGEFEANEIKVANKKAQLKKRLGSLNELFGTLAIVAGDTRENFEKSLISSQLPGRSEWLGQLSKKMATGTQLATIEEIERLWFEIQREMTESGKVVKFEATVVKPNGEQTTQEVVRIGSFNVVSNGAYLTFESEGKPLSELPKQPQARYTNWAADLQTTANGYAKFGADPTGPTGGNYLKALITSPDLRERVEQGGTVGYMILALGGVALLLALERLIVLGLTAAKVTSQAKTTTPNGNNPLGRILQVSVDNKAVDNETLELKLGEAILKERPTLERSLTFLKIISMVAPLMGLLGTVTGMIVTFQAITLFGTGDPKTMAGGISSALVTTVLGLVVAIPTVLLHTIVNGRSKRIIHILEEQSTGMIAEHAEATRGK